MRTSHSHFLSNRVVQDVYQVSVGEKRNLISVDPYPVISVLLFQKMIISSFNCIHHISKGATGECFLIKVKLSPTPLPQSSPVSYYGCCVVWFSWIISGQFLEGDKVTLDPTQGE